MKALFTFYLSLFTFLSFAQSIEVTNVRQDGTNLQVFYNFSGGTGSYIVSLHYSLDNGNTWLGPARAVSGDVGKGVKPGSNKSIVWNVLTDREHLKGETLRYKVIAKSEGETVKDIDGNLYQTLKIGNQIWMKENLRTTRYQNGETIPSNLGVHQWSNTKFGAYAIYENRPEYNVAYGKLYNWHTVADSRGVCPIGWHVPSDKEWSKLDLNNDSISTSFNNFTDFTINSKLDENYESGLVGTLGGYRGSLGSYNRICHYGYWWSSTKVGENRAINLTLSSKKRKIRLSNSIMNYGYSVRCLKD